MWMSLAIAGVLYSVATVAVGGRFEGEAPLPRRLVKLAVFFGLTVLLSAWVGAWSLLYVFGIFAVGTVFHTVWRVRNGINPLTAEPKARYYQLRGWSR